MKLKTWQKWGIAFGGVHVLVCMVFLYLRRYDAGHPSIMVLLLIIDTPIAIIGKYFFGRLFYNNEYFYIYYLLIAGTLFYFVIGVIVGQILKLIKHSRMDFKTNHIVCSVILLTLLISNNLFAYSPTKHHRHMGVRAADESNLDVYLKDNLGFSKGINTTLINPGEPEGEQTKKIYEWIGYGSRMEDSPERRATRHFYDPVTNLGLSVFSVNLESSLEWGREQDGSEDDYSWTQAQHYYYLALTSRTKEERERYWALTFRSLGQVLHLVQDLASPAHVRNDNHLPVSNNADPYEEIWGSSPEGISFIHAILAHGALGNADYQYPVVELDRFEDYWDTGDGRGLAEFTNSNFVSKDTNIDVLTGRHHYDDPRPTGLYRDPEPFTFTDSDGIERSVNVTYYTSNVVDNYDSGRSVNPFNYLTAVSFWNFYTGRYDPSSIHYTLNSKCHEEYAKLLIPRTVGYGAGLLNYFFRGRIKILNIERNANNPYIINLTISNVSEEPMLGVNLSFYMHYSNSWRTPVLIKQEGPVDILPGDSYILETPIWADDSNWPIDDAWLLWGRVPEYSFVMVIHGGQLGDEEFNDNQAIAGKMLNFIKWGNAIYKDCWIWSKNPDENYQDILSGGPFSEGLDAGYLPRNEQIPEERDRDGFRYGFLKIDISDIPLNITSAKLIYRNGHGGYPDGYPIVMHSTSTDWEETVPTWNNAPRVFQLLGVMPILYFGGGDVTIWDITDYVRSQREIGENYISMRFSPYNLSQTGMVYFSTSVLFYEFEEIDEQ